MSILIFSFGSNTWAQQLSQYTQFSFNPLAYNPAVAGTEDFFHIQANIRSQWSDIEGAPQTGLLTAHSPMNKKSIGYGKYKKFHKERWYSLGGMFIYDKTGPISSSSAYGTFAYNLPISLKSFRFSFGTNVGIKSFSYNPNGYLANLVTQNDPTIQSAFTNTTFDLNFGFWIYSNKLFLGASAFQFLKNNIINTTIDKVATGHSGNLDSHYFVMAGYKVDYNKDLYMIPSVLFKQISPAPLSFEFNLKAVYLKYYWFGIAYRYQDSFAGYAGMLVNKKLEISYSYDIITSLLRQTFFGSNEILIGYRFKPQRKVICPKQFW